MEYDIREPKQKRSIEKKEKIIDAGWQLISENGYYNTNTAEIAKKAGVSTGIIYQYFKDKHDILIAGIDKYGNEIFYPMIKLENKKISTSNIENILTEMIEEYIHNHKISQNAHEEIMSMVHIDKEIAHYYYQREMLLTNTLANALSEGKIQTSNLLEKVHIAIGMIDNLCHEIVYHKHNNLDYNEMKKLVIKSILIILQKEKTID